MNCKIKVICFSLVIFIFNCKNSSESTKGDYEIASLHATVLNEVEKIYGADLAENDTIYYIENSACVLCKKKFWNFYLTQEDYTNIKVIHQINNKRISIYDIIPDYLRFADFKIRKTNLHEIIY